MQQFELDYAKLIAKIMANGEVRETRNGRTQGTFGESLTISMYNNNFPLIQGRKMYPKGILGELAALLRKPKNIKDFEAWGCNYWKLWADNEEGDIRVDYGNAWFDFNGFDQIADLKEKLRNNPMDRRMIINAWRPGADLSLPCCHYSYQFYVSTDNSISMIWTQRSADMMIGVPSDIVLAAAWLIAIANEFGFSTGHIKMDFGDCHVYEEHWDDAYTYIDQVVENAFKPVTYEYTAEPGSDFCAFEPSFLQLGEYEHSSHLALELKA